MKHDLKLEELLAPVSRDRSARMACFAFVNLGVIDSLANGVVSAVDAVRHFYNAENCLFVQDGLKDKTASRIMSHGVQLPDLFDCLPAETAQREFLHELATMRSLCLKLLESERQVA